MLSLATNRALALSKLGEHSQAVAVIIWHSTRLPACLPACLVTAVGGPVNHAYIGLQHVLTD